MFRNYIKIAWRDLVNNRRLGIINIIGLSLSVACCLLLFFYIAHENSYDQFHEKKNRLFRLEMSSPASSEEQPAGHFFSFLTKENDRKNRLAFPLVVGPDMKQVFPEVKRFIRFTDHHDYFVKAGEVMYKEDHIIFADPGFFTSFSFPLKKGSRAALANPGNIVISEKTARKYFGDADPIGKTVALITDSMLLTVAAVAEDAPANSSIQFNLVIPLMAEGNYTEFMQGRFNHSSHLLIAELDENVQPARFEQKLNVWMKKYYLEPYRDMMKSFHSDADDSKFKWVLRPLAGCHYNISGPWGHYTDANNIYQLGCIVVIILLIATLNYVLLVISNAAARSQEVGIRKVMGAARKALMLQFWIETQLVVLISVGLGLLFTRLLLPLFNSMIGSNLVFTGLPWHNIIPALLLLSLLLGLAAGFYPALLLSGMKPLSVIKSFQTFRITPRLSRVLVVLQYTGCVVLMIAAFIINQQMKYVRNKDLGFDKEKVILVSNPSSGRDFTLRMRTQLRNFAGTRPYVLQYSGIYGSLSGSYNSNGFQFRGEQQWLKQFGVDYDYFEMLGIRFLQGRPFSRNFPTDSSTSVRSLVINQAMFSLLGDSAKLGEYCRPLHGTIIGVVQDYNFETLSNKIEPQEHVFASGYVEYFMFKLQGGHIPQEIDEIGREWKRLTDYPFEYAFLDDTIAKMYEADLRWQKTIQASCFFAIFIACLGLFGLSAINAINRTKEIGIRKVLGASVKDIVATLSASFLLMICLSILIAAPIAWWMMNKWLEDFAYRISISWWMFAGMGGLALLIAFATVSFQAVKAAVVNPVESLRTE